MAKQRSINPLQRHEEASMEEENATAGSRGGDASAVESSSSSGFASVSKSSVLTTTDHDGKGGAQSSSSNSSLSLARAETRMVFRSKLLVFFVLGLAAIICATSTYIFAKNSEHDVFQKQFLAYATEIADISHAEALNTVHAVESLSALITSAAQTAGMAFPNVTVGDFDVHGKWNNMLSKVTQITYAPLIQQETQGEWEAFVQSGNQTSSKIHSWETSEAKKEKEEEESPWDFAPVWQQAPSTNTTDVINFDLLSHPVIGELFCGMYRTQKPVLSKAMKLDFLYGDAVVDDDVNHPHSILLDPIYSKLHTASAVSVDVKDDMVGLLAAVVSWDRYFSDILHENNNGVILVLANTCGEHFTYRIDGALAIFLGNGDLHDRYYDDMVFRTPFAPFLHVDDESMLEHKDCEYDLRIYPSAMLENRYTSIRPILYAVVILIIFMFTSVTFLLFDYTVALRQEKVMQSAKRTHKIVSSLFPSHVRDQILRDAEAEEQQKSRALLPSSSARQLKDYLGGNGGADTGTKPIAELYPCATVMFADIVGFTAWSSAREPYQVFQLLETVYQAFDEIAKRRRVFKVETIGDCYVAVAGLPDPRPDHAVAMSRFAQECLLKMSVLTKQMETTLGPDTADLDMRFGLHSGPVTAGVLRGDKGRFQLFGDTVNTAARMESTGAPNKIHCSQATAALLEQAGKFWTKPRDDLVVAKGKGELQTHWVELGKNSSIAKSRKTASTSSGHGSSVGSVSLEIDEKEWVDVGLRVKPKITNGTLGELQEKESRLVDWYTDILCKLLWQIAAQNNVCESSASSASTIPSPLRGKVIDEVVEVIEIPELCGGRVEDANTPLSPIVVEQVRNYVQSIASRYPKNHFHNFEHASHVAMSVSKLLSRMSAPVDGTTASNLAYSLHDQTYGIASDALTQFACVFAALIHDVDHPGVPNAQLVKERASVAVLYDGKSVAEQNSVVVAWGLLLDSTHEAFRKTLCATPADLQRFRQLVVNIVMATDLMDPDLKNLRNKRWAKAFENGGTMPKLDLRESAGYATEAAAKEKEHRNRRATIVLEHLMQASDVAHTMQHWHIYRKWNERLFHEMMAAYRQGRSQTNPADVWYNGELWFFDNYIIPLAKKLQDCGVFGVSSDEYLAYAEKNRAEWALYGADIVSQMVERHDALPPSPASSSKPAPLPLPAPKIVDAGTQPDESARVIVPTIVAKTSTAATLFQHQLRFI